MQEQFNEEIETLKAVITERNITIKQQQEHNDNQQLEIRKVTGQKMKWRSIALELYKWMKHELSPAYWEDFSSDNCDVSKLLEDTIEREREVKV